MRINHNVKFLVIAVAIICCAAWIALAAEDSSAQNAPAGLRIAVVDMQKVLSKSKQWQDAAEERMQLLQNAKTTLAKLTEQAQVLKNDYDSLPPGTKEQAEKKRQVAEAIQKLQQVNRDFETKITAHHNKSARLVFQNISDAVKSYAEENDLSLVLKKQTIDTSQTGGAEQNLLLATTEVLYASPELDISAAIIERLNADYSGPIEAK